jgi:hypothetical protein
MSNAGLGSSQARIFWGEIAPNEHIAHFYDDNEVFLATLAGFIAQGLAKVRAPSSSPLLNIFQHSRSGWRITGLTSRMRL